jgi:ABC-type multidrug transport system fused ATPase/permease subunit
MLIRYFISRIWRDQPLRLLLSISALAVASLLEGVGAAAIVPLLQIVGAGATPGADTGTIGQMLNTVLSWFNLPLDLSTALGFILVVILASEAATLFSNGVQASSGVLLEATLRKRLFAAVFDADWPYFVRTKSTDLMSALISDAGRAGRAYRLLVELAGAIIMSAVYLTLALVLSWQLTLAVAVVVAVVLSLLGRRANRGAKFGQELTQVDAEIHSLTQEDLTAAKLVKASSSETEVKRRFDALNEVRQHVMYRNQMNQALLKTLYNVATVMMLFLGIYIAVTFFGMTVATLTVFLFAFYRLSPRVASLQATQSEMQSLIPGVMRADEYTAMATDSRETSGGRPLGQFSKAIELVDVSFSYDAEHPVLYSISLTIPCGGSTAIVGPSGAGKTTVMDLIMSLLLPQSGEILIDGASLRDVRLSDWRRQIGYVPQDASFFHATVAENIGWGAENVSRSDIIEAAKLAEADEFIRSFPEGYDTIIGDRGMRMSGGQRQRLALARAIVRNPSILVLDEATSALDARSEEKIQVAVDRLSASMTVLIVTHRLATVRGCSLIYVLDSGKLVESGSWNELLARNGQFAKLVELQSLGTRS